MRRNICKNQNRLSSANTFAFIVDPMYWNDYCGNDFYKYHKNTKLSV